MEQQYVEDNISLRNLTVLSMCLPMLQLLDSLENTPAYKQRLKVCCKEFSKELSKVITKDFAPHINNESMTTAYALMDCHLDLAKTIATLRAEQLPDVILLIEDYKKTYDEQVRQKLSGSNHQLHTS